MCGCVRGAGPPPFVLRQIHRRPHPVAKSHSAVGVGPTGHSRPLTTGGEVARSGPDMRASWLHLRRSRPALPLALGHRRLATLELSAEGHQPMTSPISVTMSCVMAKYTITTLRRQLGKAGYSAWRGTSDTETLLAAIMHWGVRRALQACVGMFALAVWDNHTQRLTLARDRMGEKPLYYGWVGKHFFIWFGTQSPPRPPRLDGNH